MYPRETIDVLDTHRFDVSALERYVRERIEDAEPPFKVRQFRGGQSNPTYYIETSSKPFVLRRKPPGHLLPSAHAVEREYQVMTALRGSGVAVPKTHLLCEDASVIGTPFFIMEYVDGHPMTDATLPDRSSEDRRASTPDSRTVDQGLIVTTALLEVCWPMSSVTVSAAV